MKIKVVPAHRFRGVQCYSFIEQEQQEAFKALTGQNTASQTKLDALAAFGVVTTVIGETTQTVTNAVQESN